jgi:hypothetical protein
LIIRSQQVEAFQEQAEAGLVKKLAEYLRAYHADQIVKLPDGVTLVQYLPEQTFCGLIRQGIGRARRYGMTWEASLGAFVLLMFISAPNFDEHPLVQRILRDESVEPNARIDHLLQRASEQNWEAVEQYYAPAAWNQAPAEAAE